MSNLSNNFPGNFRKSSKGYKYFLVGDIFKSLNLKFDLSIYQQVEKASLALGAFSSLIKRIPEPSQFIQAYCRTEATLSSRIEGTQSTIEEAFMQNQDIKLEKRDDWVELQSYIQALEESITNLENLPVCTRLIRLTHKTLLSQVRGKTKQPGEFRHSQNWIGGSRPDNAHFVPPSSEFVDEAMSNLEKFIQDKTIPIAHLIKVALIHSQFETIHPFSDGNGRIGRMLISLYLLENRILDSPILYISSFFERNRKEYYVALDLARTNQEGIMKWISFFLDGVYQTANEGIDTTQKLIDLRENLVLEVIPKLGRSAEQGSVLLENLFKQPVVTAKDVRDILNISSPSAQKFLAKFTQLKILVEITGNKRNRIFVFKKYLSLLHSSENS